MENQTTTIKIPKGKEIDQVDFRTGKVTFKKKPENIIAKIETVADVLEANGLTQKKFDLQCAGLTEDEINYRILKMLAKTLNEGWEPNWNDENEDKYFPWFYMGGSSGFRFDVCGSWSTASGVGSRLCFKSRELTEYAANQFTDVYKKFMTI